MATYTIPYFSLASADVNVAGIIEEFRSGEQWDWHAPSNPTFALNVVNTVYQAQVIDTADGMFDDDPGAATQTLAADVVDDLGTVLWTAGSTIEDEYEVDLTDAGGTTYRLVAISIDDIIVGFTFEGAMPPVGTTLYYTAGNWHDFQTLDPANAVVCFAADTLIATARGDKPAGLVEVDDMVLTRDSGFQPVRWVGRRALSSQELFRAPHLRPIQIAAGALGPGIPRRDLRLSPQHRVLVRSRIAARMFGENEILVAAKNLTSLPGVDIDERSPRVTYVHLLFDRHEVIYANGAPSESLYCGANALAILDPPNTAGLQNLLPVEPDQAPPLPARLVAPGRRSRKLAERLVKNGKRLIDRSAG